MKVIDFLRLTHQRFMAKSPAYFKSITIAMTVCGVLVGLPEFLDMFAIEVPKVLAPYISKAIAAAAFALAFLSQLTVEDPAKAKLK